MRAQLYSHDIMTCVTPELSLAVVALLYQIMDSILWSGIRKSRHGKCQISPHYPTAGTIKREHDCNGESGGLRGIFVGYFVPYCSFGNVEVPAYLDSAAQLLCNTPGDLEGQQEFSVKLRVPKTKIYQYQLGIHRFSLSDPALTRNPKYRFIKWGNARASRREGFPLGVFSFDWLRQPQTPT